LGQVTCPAQRFWPLNQLPGRFFAVAVDLRNTLLEVQTNKEGQGILRYTGNATGTDVIRIWAGADQYEALPAHMKAEVTIDWINEKE
jgi:hypothetical protein